MSIANIAFLIVGALVSLLAFIGLMSAVKGTPVAHVCGLTRGPAIAVRDAGFREVM